MQVPPVETNFPPVILNSPVALLYIVVDVEVISPFFIFATA